MVKLKYASVTKTTIIIQKVHTETNTICYLLRSQDGNKSSIMYGHKSHQNTYFQNYTQTKTRYERIKWYYIVKQALNY